MDTKTHHTKEELERLIGNAPQGSHPDEWYPRDDSWHAERINWMEEVERLRTENVRLQHRIAAIDKAVQKDCPPIKMLARDSSPAAGSDARCYNCGKPATCYGQYEDMEAGYACDDCCGHGCEDGKCVTVAVHLNKKVSDAPDSAAPNRRQSDE